MARKTVAQMWAEANERIELVSAKGLAEEIAFGDILLLDARLPIEIERRGTSAGSVPVPRQVVECWADPDSPYFRPDGVFGDFDRRVVTFCDGGGNGEEVDVRFDQTVREMYEKAGAGEQCEADETWIF